jgi:hypothetical protein
MEYTIRGIKQHNDFIMKLREKLAKRKKDRSGSIEVEEVNYGNLSVPVLPNLNDLVPGNRKKTLNEENKQDLLLLIELRAEKGDNRNGYWATTLAMRKDNLYIVGFTGEGGMWFELDDGRGSRPLPTGYSATPLGWDVHYRSIMNLKDQDQVKETLSKTRLGAAFAKRAVRRLSQYPVLDYNDKNLTGLGLAGLLVLICESARMDTIRRVFAKHGVWARGVLLEENELDCIWEWGTVSAALMRYKKHGYKRDYEGNSDLLHRMDIRLVNNSDNVEGGARVEISAVSTDFRVSEVTVIDNVNTNGCIICNQDERQTEQVPTRFVSKYLL